jgi:hypothetical protein
LGEQRFSRTRRADEQDVRFLNLDVGSAPLDHVDSFVVLIDGDGQLLFGVILSDDIIVEKFLDLYGFGQRGTACCGFLMLIIGDDLVANIYALVTDVNRWACYQLLDLVLGFAAKRASQCIVASSH